MRSDALEHEGGSVAQADVADLVLPIDGPVEAALAAAPDVLETSAKNVPLRPAPSAAVWQAASR